MLVAIENGSSEHPELRRQCAFRSVRKHGKFISDIGVVELEHFTDRELTSLIDLSLYDTKITDADLARLKELPSLRKLDVRRTKITDAGLPNDNNWSLSDDTGGFLDLSVDGFHARSTTNAGDILFREAVDFVELDFMLPFFDTDQSITITALDSNAVPISTSTINLSSAQSLSVVTGRIDAPGLIRHLRLTREVGYVIDTVRFGPEIDPVDDTTSAVPEPSTFLLATLGLPLLFTRRRRRR